MWSVCSIYLVSTPLKEGRKGWRRKRSSSRSALHLCLPLSKQELLSRVEDSLRFALKNWISCSLGSFDFAAEGKASYHHALLLWLLRGVMDRINNASVYTRYLSSSLVKPAVFEAPSERPPGLFIGWEVFADLLRCRLRSWSFIAQLLRLLMSNIIHHCYWFTTALGPVSQQVWLVGHAWWSMAWSTDQNDGMKRKMRKDSEGGDWDNLLCRWETKNICQDWRFWMHFSDTWVCVYDYVYLEGGRVGWTKNAKIKAQCQNIWLPGNKGSSNTSIELWRMVEHDSTSQIRFQVGERGGGRGTKTEKCLCLSRFVRAAEHWHWALHSFSLGVWPWHIKWGPEGKLRFRGLLVLRSIQVISTACNLKMISLDRHIKCQSGDL